MTNPTYTSVTGLSAQEVETAFDALQRKLVPLWEFIGAPTQEEHTILVIPSMTLDHDFHGAEVQNYEERFLFMLFLLRQPRVRIVYVTSLAIQPAIIDYYLHILPGVVASHALKRLFFVSPLDASSEPLSRKLLKRPRLMEHIRSLVRDPNRAHIVPYNTTDLERELSVRLGIPMYAADPRFFAFGTKSGSRRVFAEEGVRHPLGYENLYGLKDIMSAIQEMRAAKPNLGNVILKLNDEVTGAGNATVDLTGVTSESEIEARLRTMRYELADLTYDSYIDKFEHRGGIIEEYISGQEFQSPSAQLRVTPLGEVEMLSTHDQMLGGPSGQTYLGARFPANPEYGPLIMHEASKVGRRFAREGIVGRFALDFVVVRQQGGPWQAYAIEVNLRKGGTTHPFLTLQYLTDGAYRTDTGVFVTALGHPKCYVATDHLASPAYRGLTPDDLFDVVSKQRLHYDHTSQSGVVFHMMTALGDRGILGMTAISDSRADADALYDKTVALIDQEARAATKQ